MQGEKEGKSSEGQGTSMPGLKVKVTFELSPHEHELVSKKAGMEMGASVGRENVNPSKAFVYCMSEILATCGEGS